MFASTGTNVNNPVRLPNRFLVVFDHDQRVTQVAQPDQRADQPFVISLMQANTGFIEYVKHAGQARSNLSRKSYPLRLSASECPGGAIK